MYWASKDVSSDINGQSCSLIGEFAWWVVKGWMWDRALTGLCCSEGFWKGGGKEKPLKDAGAHGIGTEVPMAGLVTHHYEYWVLSAVPLFLIRVLTSVICHSC